MDAVVRHVAVVGGSGGIGRAMATRFAQGGCAVHLLGRDAERLGAAARDIADATGALVVPVACNLDDPDSLSRAFAGPQRLDVLINAAGSIPRKSLLQSTPQDWRGSWSDKVLGAVETSRLACGRMRETGGGVIVNIIGISGVHLNPKSILTSTANAALSAFTQALGAQSVDWNIRVVGINPGLTATNRTQDLMAGVGGDAYEATLANLPFRRAATVQEIAQCAWFLASDAAQYISGAVVDVDAGARWRT